MIEFKSAKQVAIGVVKILSGFTLVIPIIFAVGYYTSRIELRKLESLCDRVSKALQSVDNIKKITQNDLIKFISKNVLDRDENQDFEAAFQRLELTSQNLFFDSMADKGVLVDALARVPQDIREINVGFGQNPSRETIDKTIMQLCTFKQLHTITFDLSQTTHYTQRIENLLKYSIDVIQCELDSFFAETPKVSFELPCDFYNVSGINSPNNFLPVSRLIHGVVYHLIKDSLLARINFNFQLKPGELRPTYIANHSRMEKIPEDDANQADKNNSLNYIIPSPDTKDMWFAQTNEGFYLPKGCAKIFRHG